LGSGFDNLLFEAAISRQLSAVSYSNAECHLSLGSGFDNLLFEAAISRQLSAVRHSMAERLIVECGVRNVECGILQIRLWGQALIICYRHGRAEVQGTNQMRNAEFGMRNEHHT